MSAIERPGSDEYDAFYAGYVGAVPDGELLATLASQGEAAGELLAAVDEEKALFRYAPGKWSVKDVVGHLIDAERVFSYRALCVARGDRTPLPGFDSDEYVVVAASDRRPLAELAGELAAVRGATLALFGGLRAEEIDRRGEANGSAISVRALAWIIAGHERHHLRVLAERYGL